MIAKTPQLMPAPAAAAKREVRSKSLNFRFSTELYDRLEAAAVQEDRTLNSMCRLLLDKALERWDADQKRAGSKG